MRWSAFAAAILSGLVAPGTVAQTQPVPDNVVPIRVQWDGPPPTRVSFDGGADFDLHGDFFEGRRPAKGMWALQKLAIVYGTYEVPLRVITRVGEPDLKFRVFNAQYGQCDPDEVNTIYRASLEGTVNARIAAMMRARRLVELEKDPCPTLERRKMAKMYFRLNCSLARDKDAFIALSEEAAGRYEELAVTPDEKREARSCSGVGEAGPLRQLLLARNAAKQEGDIGRFNALNAELLQHVGEDAWQSGFQALRLNVDNLRTSQVDALYDRQIDAGKGGRMEEALQLNSELLGLKARPEFRAAFSAAHVNGSLLQRDRSHYQAVSDNR
jgi:hypothetical protein